MYFTYYILFAVVGNTIVKRIKAKCFWKTTFTGKICYFLIKIQEILQIIFVHPWQASAIFVLNSLQFPHHHIPQHKNYKY